MVDVPPSFKVIALGPYGVGKTSLYIRCAYNEYDENRLPTIGVDALPARIVVGDETVNLRLWDSSGAERFRAVVPAYYRFADAVLILFDITSRSSFDSIVPKDLIAARENAPPTAQLFLAGTKSDLAGSRQVSTEEAQAYAAANSLLYFETSAKTGEGVAQLFQGVAERMPEVPAGRVARGIVPAHAAAPSRYDTICTC